MKRVNDISEQLNHVSSLSASPRLLGSALCALTVLSAVACDSEHESESEAAEARMDRFPEGLAVLGDSHCSFNPIYGQGMTTAGLGALILGDCLRAQRRSGHGSIAGLSRRFQAELARATDDPWTMATGEDLRYPEIEARRPFGYGLMKWYTGRVHRAVAHDTELALHFLRAMHMLEPPTALLTPRMALRVLAGGRSR